MHLLIRVFPLSIVFSVGVMTVGLGFLLPCHPDLQDG